MSITPDLCKVYIFKEPSFRGDSAITEAVACDWSNQLKDTFPWAEPQRNRTSYSYIGGGRNVGRIVDLGFSPGKSSVDFNLLTGMFLYYALGKSTTRGDSTVFTDTVTATATGTNSVVLTFATAPTGVEVDMVLVYIDGSGNIYTYRVIAVDTTALTITIYANDPTETADLLNGNSISVETGNYTHTIQESNTLPSFSLHLEQTLSGEEIYVDLLGCLVQELSITMEAGSDTPVMCNVSLIVAKEVESTALTVDPDTVEKEFFVRANLTNLSLTYDGTEIESDLLNQCDKVVWKITNDIDMKNVLGDEYPNKVLIGARTYEIQMHPYIRTNLWHTISRLKCPNYLYYYGDSGYYSGPIAFSFQLTRDATTDYISVSHTHLVMDSKLEYAHPSWEDKELGLDITFSQAPRDSVAVEVKDDLTIKYYEVATT